MFSDNRDVNPKPDPCAGPSCAGHWGKFFEWPSAQSATPFYNEVKAVILRQGRRAYRQALANEADPQLPTPRGGPPGNRGPPARRTRAMPSALLPQDIKGYLLSTVTRQLYYNSSNSQSESHFSESSVDGGVEQGGLHGLRNSVYVVVTFHNVTPTVCLEWALRNTDCLLGWALRNAAHRSRRWCYVTCPP